MSDAVFIYLGRCVLFRLLPAVRTNSEAGLHLLRVWPTYSIPNPTCSMSLQELHSVKNYTQLGRGKGPASGLGRKSALLSVLLMMGWFLSCPALLASRQLCLGLIFTLNLEIWVGCPYVTSAPAPACCRVGSFTLGNQRQRCQTCLDSS